MCGLTVSAIDVRFKDGQCNTCDIVFSHIQLDLSLVHIL